MEKRILYYRKYIDMLLGGELGPDVEFADYFAGVAGVEEAGDEKRTTGVEEAGDENKKTWQDVLDEHLCQVAFFQHERLIHLIVTVTFAILTVVALAAYIISENIALVALIVMLLVLLIPYIRHYYILENEVQKMYRQYDRLVTLARKR